MSTQSKGRGSASNESIDSKANPTPIDEKTIKSFAELDVTINRLIRKGEYGVIYEGQFGQKFIPNTFRSKFKCDDMQVKAFPKDKCKFAIKYVDIEIRTKLEVLEVKESVDREVSALMTIDHKNIVSLFCAIAMNNKKKWYLFMELSDGNLQSFMKRWRKSCKKISEHLVKCWVKKLGEALHYLQNRKITHGYIKSSNILVFGTKEDQMDVKLADFVFAKIETKDNVSVEQTQALEERMENDVIAISFVFTDLLAITSFDSSTNQKFATDSVHKLLNSCEGPQRELNTFLSTAYLNMK